MPGSSRLAKVQYVDCAEPGLDLVSRPQCCRSVDDVGLEPRRLHSVGLQVPRHGVQPFPAAGHQRDPEAFPAEPPGCCHPQGWAGTVDRNRRHGGLR